MSESAKEKTKDRQSKDAKKRDSEPSQIVGVRIKVSRYKMLQEVVAEMGEENPYIRDGFSEVDLIRALIDEFLTKRGKLKGAKS
jgi:hypothetical protein